VDKLLHTFFLPEHRADGVHRRQQTFSEHRMLEICRRFIDAMKAVGLRHRRTADPPTRQPIN
jgi:hypothetical protein